MITLERLIILGRNSQALLEAISSLKFLVAKSTSFPTLKAMSPRLLSAYALCRNLAAVKHALACSKESYRSAVKLATDEVHSDTFPSLESKRQRLEKATGGRIATSFKLSTRAGLSETHQRRYSARPPGACRSLQRQQGQNK